MTFMMVTKVDENGDRVVAIEEGTPVIVNSSGTVKKNASTVDVDGVKYKVDDYVAEVKPDVE